MIEVTFAGFVANLYQIEMLCGKQVWSVNFPNPVLALTHKTLREYQLFLELVEFYLRELNTD